MGLIVNILLSIVHLILCITDIMFILIVLKIVHDRWQIRWMEPILVAVRPITSAVLNWFHPLVRKVTGRSFPERIHLVVLVICLTIFRFLLVIIFG